MKQRIKELLKLAPVSGHNSRSSYGYGDTYEKYQRRCELLGITAKTFAEWLRFEVKVEDVGRCRGYQPKLDHAVEHASAQSN